MKSLDWRTEINPVLQLKLSTSNTAETWPISSFPSTPVSRSHFISDLCGVRRESYLGWFEVPSPPVGVYSVLPDVGTLPGAVGEARLDDFPLLKGQRLIDACEEREGNRLDSIHLLKFILKTGTSLGVASQRKLQTAPPGACMSSVCSCCKDWRLTFLPAFLPPQQVVFCQDAPVATRLGRLEEILRFQERQHIQSQLLKEEGEEYERCKWKRRYKKEPLCAAAAGVYSSINTAQKRSLNLQ